MSELLRWFERTAVDPAFRELARTDPEASFQGFELEPGDREVLARQDGALLGLLARAMAPLEGPTRRGLPRVDEAPLPPPGPALAPTRLFLRLVPQLGEDGAIVHGASLHSTAAEAAPPGAVAGSVFALAIAPLSQRLPDGQIAVAYDATIAPLRQSAPGREGPLGHRVDSAEARAAAAAVLASPLEARRDRLVELVEALIG